MSLRWKIALAMASIAALTAMAFGAASYRSTRTRLLSEIDRSLTAVDVGAGRDPLPTRSPLSGFDAQLIGPAGTIRESTFSVEIPVTEQDLELIGRRGSRFETVDSDGGSYRVRTIGTPRGAVQIGRSLAETDRILSSVRARTLLIAALVSAMAIALGLWISGRVTASLRRLTTAAEHVETTGRVDVVVGEQGRDEVGRLGVAFDRMLAALARSKDEQRRLVQDAGHELRTPLTSLRTNLDALSRYPDMADADRDAIITDLHVEARELTALVDEVVAVATGGAPDESFTTFDLAEVVTELADRFGRRANRPIVVTATASPVTAQRTGIHRAISCLLENATKFDDSGGPIEVVVTGGSVTVLDRGMGIAVVDLDRIFDRFHRSDAARSMPGSGLGLSIVHEVALRHGGDVFASDRPDGGAAVGFRVGSLPPPTSM